MEKEETHMQKRRTTALKIIVDKNIREDDMARRLFLANLFDFPDYAKQEEGIQIHAIRTVRDEDQDFLIYPEMVEILKFNNVDVTAFKGYREEKVTQFKNDIYTLDRKVKEATGITDETHLHYKYAGSNDNSGVMIYTLLFELQTTGKTKTEIKGIHKENVSKFLAYLRMRKIAYQYDCEWSFEGSRACAL
jgi:wyosine [tRNA(Phe)-imidazoG37] synthetase (radical SAM superfamily)